MIDGLKTRSLQAWRKWTEGLDLQTVLVLLLSVVFLILFHENGRSSFFRAHFAKYFHPGKYSPLFPALYWYGSSFVMLGLIPLLIGVFAFKKPMKSWGVGLGDWKFGLTATAVMYAVFLPILVMVSFSPSFQSKYPLFHVATKSGAHFVIHELAYALYFIGWEFIYRGFMLFGLKDKLGYYAVFIQMIPFAIMHFGKPQIETLAAVAAGVILGYLALRAKSFWYGWLLHALIAITNDVLATIQKGKLW